MCVLLNGSSVFFLRGGCRCKIPGDFRTILVFLSFTNSGHLRESSTRRYPGVVIEGFGCGRFWSFTSISCRTFETETWAKETPTSWGGDASGIKWPTFESFHGVSTCHTCSFPSHFWMLGDAADL